MKTNLAAVKWCCLFAVFLSLPVLAQSEDANDTNVIFENDAVKITYELQHETIAKGSNSAVAIHFNAGDKWHFYADPETALAPNLYLHLNVLNDHGLKFGEPIMPEPKKYFDKTQDKNLQVYSGQFTVFLPFTVTDESMLRSDTAVVEIIGAYCSDFQCRILQQVQFSFLPSIGQIQSQAKFELPERQAVLKEAADDATVKTGFGLITFSKLLLAVVTGFLFNVMPCVLPVIPLIITKLLKHSQESKTRSLGLGLTFCFGIIGFFALIAILNIVLKIGFGTVLQWGDYFRYPWFITGMSLLLIVLGLFMFGVFSIAVPSTITGKAGSGESFSGSLGMGFLAALLSTPCSFGILAGVVAWAQTQNLAISTAVFLLMGVGMALPYAVLISFPGLLNKVPKPGDWMERVKIAMGFVLIFIAVKLLEALPAEEIINTLYYAVVLSFAVWMWGGWVHYRTSKGKKYAIRIAAVVLAVAGSFYFYSDGDKVNINWVEYDAQMIEQAIEADTPVVIKFDATWCATCKVVDKRVFQQKDIAELLEEKNVLTVKGDTTTINMPATKALENVYNEPGVPVTVVHLPGVEGPIKLRGIISKSDLKEVLERIE